MSSFSSSPMSANEHTVPSNISFSRLQMEPNLSYQYKDNRIIEGKTGSPTNVIIQNNPAN